MGESAPQFQKRLEACRKAARELRQTDLLTRNQVLLSVAKLLSDRKAEIIAANCADQKALAATATAAFRDRLLLNEERLALAATGLRQVASLADPINEEVEQRILANGIRVRRVRSPLGVILMIFESRPNVALEAFGLALKSGNVILLRGGKESMRTTQAIYLLLEQALKDSGLASSTFWGITDSDRSLLEELLKARQWIDVVVPRGGEGLIDFVVKNSHIPIIKNDRGLCHIYVHEDADLTMAQNLVVNAKTQRPGVCNAMETLLVHSAVQEKFLPLLYEALSIKGVEWFGCSRTLQTLQGKPRVLAAQAVHWDTEYLDLKMNSKVVSSLEQAIDHIETHGSRHSEAIVTRSEVSARQFQQAIDAAAVYWNASTRFTDGFELGLGGELGISTQKLHVRGPVGLKELTSVRWLLDGTGQTRS